MLFLLLILSGTAEQIGFEREVESRRYNVILTTIKLFGMVFRYAVTHDDLVVHLDAFVKWVLTRGIDVVVKEHHEVRCDFIDISLVFSHDNDIVAYVDRNRRKEIIISARSCYLPFYFVMQVIKPICCTLIASARKSDHRQFILRFTLGVLERLYNPRTLCVNTRYMKPTAVALFVYTFDLNIAERSAEHKRR